MTTTGAQVLLSNLIDYAGLFPPAGLGMVEAAAEYARHLEGPHAWMLGRFIVPAARLDELEEALMTARVPSSSRGWSLSALVGPAFTTHADELVGFNARQGGRARVESVEFRPASRLELEAALDTIPPGLAIFVELPLDGSLDELLRMVKGRGVNGKVRTGGVVREAIPGSGPLARFLEACALGGVPFKATAGLHHPVRGEHPLTYDEGAPRHTMHGFLNLFAAAALARAGMSAAEIEAVLRETDPTAFHLDGDGLGWRERRVSTDDLALMRRDFATSFGSCSFAEPVASLETMGLLP
jgi:hypothetical protein